MKTQKNILIVTKQSKVEYEADKFGLTIHQLKEKYSSEGANLPAILASHEGQLRSRAQLRDLLPEATIISMDKLADRVTDYDIVVSFGGDNSFTYVSHFIEDTLMYGVNSDPGRSVGAMCLFSSADLEALVQSLQGGDPKVEYWPRLSATIDGVPIIRATSEYFFGETARKDMSRHVMEFRGNHPDHQSHPLNGRRIEQKHSGLIISTGAGSTGWHESSKTCPHEPGEKYRFDRTSPLARFIITEPYKRSRHEFEYYGELFPGDELVVHSLNDGAGITHADSWAPFYDFSRGKTAVIRISATPLRVGVP